MNMARFATYLPDLTWLVIEPDGTARMDEGTMDADTLRTMLLGSPEQMRSPWDASVFARTDSSSLLPVNWLASLLLRQSLTPGQQVRGPLVVLGPADDDGEVTSVEQDLAEAVFLAVASAKGNQ